MCTLAYALIAVYAVLARPALAASSELSSRAIELAKPAVVIIVMHASASVAVDDVEIDQDAEVRAAQAAIAQARSGQIAPDRRSIGRRFIEILIGELAADPRKITHRIGPGDRYTARDSWLGSGFIVSPDGYVVTNAHVANHDRGAIEESLLADGIHRAVAADIKKHRDQIANAFAPFGFEVGDEFFKRFAALDEQAAREYAHLDDVDISWTVYTGVAGDLTGVSPNLNLGQHPAEVTESVGTPWPGKDVAILKIDGRDLPTLRIGDDTNLETGAHLVALGFPAVSLDVAKQRLYDPTVTSGTLSARRPMDDGWTAIQTDAATTHGNSGGPVLGPDGTVVAISVAGTEQVQGFNYLVPATVIKEYLKRLNVAWNQPSTFNDLFAQAYDAYERRHFTTAIGLFTQVMQLQPGEAYAATYIQRSREGIAEGREASDRLWWIFGAAFVIAAALVGGVFLGRRLARGARIR
jgi:S1-C subfamily serine protease